MLLVEVADEAAPFLCRSELMLEVLYSLYLSRALLGRLAPTYKGGGGRLTCQVLLGHC